MQCTQSRSNERPNPKHYDHTKFEKECIDLWIEITNEPKSHRSNLEPFCLLLPPPNVTGSLHMGHALTTTIQDLIVRFKKMLGHEVLWIPGTDHAGIATQTVVDRKILEEEKRSLRSLGREEAISRIQFWSVQSQNRIIQQLQRLGCFLNWDSFLFSMDSSANHAVRAAFKKAVDHDLIYQGNYLVNWDFGTGTALSDDEVVYEERESLLVSIWYQVDETRIAVATTRPETIWGDVAIAVHPEDQRHRHLIGKKAKIPIVGREIPIISDQRVSIEFGTGAVKITPAHDPLDYKIGLDHGLSMISILDSSGRLCNAADMTGLSIMEARGQMIERLQEGGFLLDRKRHTHRIGVSYRSGVPIEPILSKQWFFRLSRFGKELEEALQQGEIRLLPQGQWELTYLHWVRNLKDWCISRQLWWGHRIPIWWKKGTSEWICGENIPEEVLISPDEWEQDKDVLDTWFSSSIWPITTLGWPTEESKIAKFYPNSLSETGFDILFFWVTRMLVLCKFLTGIFPFRDIYLHGLIYAKSYWIGEGESLRYLTGNERKAYERGEVPIPKNVQTKWEKMSKSKGNIMDPIELAEEYGTDAMRIALISLINESKQLDLDYRKFEEYRHFTNKLWHASRFLLKILADLDEGSISDPFDLNELDLEDRWILSKWSNCVNKITTSLNGYEFSPALQTLLSFFWDDFCDYYLELVKHCIYKENVNQNKKILKRNLFVNLFIGSLRLHHPFTPFITEKLLSEITDAANPFRGNFLDKEKLSHLFIENDQSFSKDSCILCPYPSFEPSFINEDVVSSF
ncbi:valine--tRNA ligase [Candidatus Similichlamydia epinepheli]|uniref:valine--tRNA ligase n=1 Tax=Candidatus Similichlamydia epinepheli TaxID=1903953 RepID=UPI000D3AA773|nr:valine--tRNA ligase [Candidatus Similichlamydia epinepheli]